MTVALDQRIHFTLARQRLHHRNIDLPCGFGLAATDCADHALADAKEGL
ncbi:MAG: hypothetical protein ACYC05_13765 [Sulfuricella sp.]